VFDDEDVESNVGGHVRQVLVVNRPIEAVIINPYMLIVQGSDTAPSRVVVVGDEEDGVRVAVAKGIVDDRIVP
jgi:hypothetical protein